jgi:hypothetical protein
MSSERESPHAPGQPGVEMPAPTAWPLVLGVGVALLGLGVATNLAISAVGVVLFAVGLAGWIGDMLSPAGHAEEPFVPPGERARPAEARPGTVELMRPGLPGYRFQLPEKVHPLSAGIKGGIVGGLVMPIPALLWGLLSGNGIWFPINLLAGMVLPEVVDETQPMAEQIQYLQAFHLHLFVIAVLIHAVLAPGIGLIYGVLTPSLPYFPGGPVLWGGVLTPLVWSLGSYGFMGVINPLMEQHVDWPWFVVSQVVYGVTTALVVRLSEQVPVPPVGPGTDDQAVRQGDTETRRPGDVDAQ